MIRKISTAAYGVSQIKSLLTRGVSLPKGLQVTYPNLNNKTEDILNPLETLISSLAACEAASLKAVASRGSAKLGRISFSRIESSYDLSHWAKGGGKDNKINDVFIEAEVESNVTDE